MSEDNEKVRAYLTAFRAFKKATVQTEAMAQAAHKEAAKLSSWRPTAEATSVNGEGGLEPGNLQGAEVRDMLVAWQRARKELSFAWDDISKDDREGLIPPEHADPGAPTAAT